MRIRIKFQQHAGAGVRIREQLKTLKGGKGMEKHCKTGGGAVVHSRRKLPVLGAGGISAPSASRMDRRGGGRRAKGRAWRDATMMQKKRPWARKGTTGAESSEKRGKNPVSHT